MAADIRVSTVIAHRNKSLLGFVSVWSAVVYCFIYNLHLRTFSWQVRVASPHSPVGNVACKSSYVACLK